MDLVPPYDVMCLHRRISTSWLFSSLFLFQPANKNPTWSQSRGAGGGGRGVACWWCCLHRQQQAAATAAVAVAGVVLRLWTGIQGKPGGQQPGLTGRRPLGRGS